MSAPDTALWSSEWVRAVEPLPHRVEAVHRQIAKTIIGQREAIDDALYAVLACGHCLIEGVPGLGKTLLVRAMGRVLQLKFRRVQFTRDLMPADITGTMILQEPNGRREFLFIPGPVFTHLRLAHEINRTPPKTQAALLESIQERSVTVAGHAAPLEEPFVVLATQNPIEQEGTYPLPEGQLDRFLFHLKIDYPSMEEERVHFALCVWQAILQSSDEGFGEGIVFGKNNGKPCLREGSGVRSAPVATVRASPFFIRFCVVPMKLTKCGMHRS